MQVKCPGVTDGLVKLQLHLQNAVDMITYTWVTRLCEKPELYDALPNKHENLRARNPSANVVWNSMRIPV